MVSSLKNRFNIAYRHSGEQFLEVVPGNCLTLGDEEAGFPDNRLEDIVQQFVVQSAQCHTEMMSSEEDTRVTRSAESFRATKRC